MDISPLGISFVLAAPTFFVAERRFRHLGHQPLANVLRYHFGSQHLAMFPVFSLGVHSVMCELSYTWN